MAAPEATWFPADWVDRQNCGRRLRALGLDVRTELDVENWFLNGPTDTRSSYYLETPATEFGIQGLELDWTGLCWGIDLVPGTADWNIRAFKGTHWRTVRDATRQPYALNKYRVLLTRAREETIICVPRGDPADWTRPPAEYESIRNLPALVWGSGDLILPAGGLETI